MMIGHYATALVAKDRVPEGALWLFLIASQVADLAMVLLTFAGVESMEPQRFVDVALKGLSVDMTYSHDLIPMLAWAAGMAIFGWIISRSGAVALTCGLLVVVHEAIDLVAGFPHHVMGASTPRLGMDLYGHQPELALALEVLLGATCVWFFVRGRRRAGRPLRRSRVVGLYALFIGMPMTFLPMASEPISRFFG